MNFRDCLIAQFAAHPSTAPQDAVKQCYQAAFGAEHLLTDTSLAAAYLEREFNDTPAADVPLCEKIAPDVGRINLASWKAPAAGVAHAHVHNVGAPRRGRRG